MRAAAARGSTRQQKVLVLAALLLLLAAPAPAAGGDELSPAQLDALLARLLARRQRVAAYVRGAAFKSRVARDRAAADADADAATDATGQQQAHHRRRGVLIPAGGRDMLANAAVTLHVLRRDLGSRLPVEIVHFGADEAPADVVAVLRSYNSSDAPVFVTDALLATPQEAAAGATYDDGDDGDGDGSSSGSSSNATNTSSSSTTSSSNSSGGSGSGSSGGSSDDGDDQGMGRHRRLKSLKGFPAKAYALAFATRFAEVLLLDADALPLVAPELLFEAPAFKRAGSLFWPDLWHSAWVNASIYTVLAGLERPPWHGRRAHRLVDSGQLLLDRVRHADALEYLWLLNSHSEWTYKHMHGDKDTFLLAFHMAGKARQFKQVPCWARDALVEAPGHQHRFHHLGMVQSLPAASLALAALAYAGDVNATVPPPPPLPSPPPEDSSGSGSAPQHHEGGAYEDADADAADADDSADDSADDGDDGDGNDDPAAAPSPRAQQQEPPWHRHVGAPVVLHRTSFNSKFFPDCLGEDKARTKYCEVAWVSVPLADAQAGRALKPHMYAFDADQVDTAFFEQHCGGAGAGEAEGGGGAAATAGGGGGGEEADEQPAPQEEGQEGEEGGGDAAAAAAAEAARRRRQMPRLRRLLLGHHLLVPLRWLLAPAMAPLPHQPPQQPQQPTQRPRRLLLGGTVAGRFVGVLRRRSGGGGNATEQQLRDALARLGGPPPELGCDALRVGDDEAPRLPIPVISVGRFPGMAATLNRSYAAFAEVRKQLKV